MIGAEREVRTDSHLSDIRGEIGQKQINDTLVHPPSTGSVEGGYTKDGRGLPQQQLAVLHPGRKDASAGVGGSVTSDVAKPSIEVPT